MLSSMFHRRSCISVLDPIELCFAYGKLGDLVQFCISRFSIIIIEDSVIFSICSWQCFWNPVEGLFLSSLCCSFGLCAHFFFIAKTMQFWFLEFWGMFWCQLWCCFHLCSFCQDFYGYLETVMLNINSQFDGFIITMEPNLWV